MVVEKIWKIKHKFVSKKNIASCRNFLFQNLEFIRIYQKVCPKEKIEGKFHQNWVYHLTRSKKINESKVRSCHAKEAEKEDYPMPL
jgi:hypothetical protein